MAVSFREDQNILSEDGWRGVQLGLCYTASEGEGPAEGGFFNPQIEFHS